MRRKTKVKKLLALCLVLAMVLSMNVTVFAEESAGAGDPSQSPTQASQGDGNTDAGENDEQSNSNSVKSDLNEANDETTPAAQATGDEDASADSGNGDQSEAANVAEINGTGYESLQSAIDTATDGTTIKLLENTAESITVSDGKNIVLDLNGKTLTNGEAETGKCTITNAGTLTIIDNSGGGSITTIEGTTVYTISNSASGTMVFGETNKTNDFNIETQATVSAGTGPSMVQNYGEMTVNGGAFNGGLNNIKNEENGKLTINAGTFTHKGTSSSATANIFNYSEVVINGGTFTATKALTGYSAYNVFNTRTSTSTSGSSLVVKGGSFTAETSTIYNNGGLNNVQVFDGTHNKSVNSNCCPAGYFSMKDATSGKYVIVKGNIQLRIKPLSGSIATVGGYDTIKAALEEAKTTENVEKIQLVLTNDHKEDVVIPSQKDLNGATVEIYLNGHKLTNVESHTIHNYGSLTITAGTANTSIVDTSIVDNVTHQKAAVYNEVGAEATLSYATFTRSAENGISKENSGGNSYYVIVNHGTMTFSQQAKVNQKGQFSSLVENGWYDGSQNTTETPSVMTIQTNTTFTGGLNTIKNDDYGDLTILGGTFSNTAQASVMNWNVATISGGTFTSDHAVILNGYLDSTMDQGKLTITKGTFTAGDGYAVIKQNSDNGIGTVTISGGTFNAGKDADAIVQQTADEENSTVAISAGSFNMVIPENQCAEGYIPVTEATDGMYTVEVLNESNSAAVIGEKYYASLDKAIEAVEAGQTIKLLKNVTIEDNTPVKIVDKGTAESPITLDLNGHDISGSNENTGSINTSATPGGILWVSEAHVVLTDNSAETNKGAIINTAKSAKKISAVVVNSTKENDSELIIENNVKIEVDAADSTQQGLSAVAILVYTVDSSYQNASVVINEAEVKSSNYIYYGSTNNTPLVINGGTFESLGTGNSSGVIALYNIKNATINGGTFTNIQFSYTALQKLGENFVAAYEKNDAGKITVNVIDTPPTDYVAHLTGSTYAEYDKVYLKSGDLYVLQELGMLDGKTIEVVQNATITFPEGKSFGVANGAPKEVTFDLADNVTLSGNISLQLADIKITGRGTTKEFTCSPYDNTFEMTSNGENNLYSCRLTADNLVAVLTKANGVEMQYSDLATAWRAVLSATNSGSTLKLYKDGKVSKQNIQYNTTVDLNGHTLEYNTTNSTGTYAFAVSGSLILKDSSENGGGNLTVSGAATASIAIKGGKVIIEKGVTVKGSTILLDVANGKLEVAGMVDTTGTKNTAIQGNGTAGKGNTAITIKDGAEVKADAENGIAAIYHPQSGTLNIEGGTITGATGIYMKSGTLSITGGTISAEGTKYDYQHNGDGYNPTGDAIVLDACGYPGGAPVVNTFEGATVMSQNAKAVECYYYAGTDSETPNADIEDKNFITGGIFSNDVTEYCETGLAATQMVNSNNYTIGTAKHTVALYSSLADGKVTSIATLSGGGTYEYNTNVVVKATAMSGYEFKGWHKITDVEEDANGNVISVKYDSDVASSDASYAFDVTEDISLVAVYEAKEMVTLRIGGTDDFSVNGKAQTSGYHKQFAVGTPITVKYTNDSKAFYHWKNGSDKIVSTAGEYTFTIVSNTDLTPVFEKQGVSNGAFVEFISAYDQVMQAEMWYADDSVYELPAGPSKLGGIFKFWSMDDLSEATVESIIGAISNTDGQHIVVKPVYDSTGQKYTVTINCTGDDVTAPADSTLEYTAAEGDGVTVTAPEIDGKSFAYWSTDENDGTILSYSSSYFVRASQDMTLYAVYSDGAVAAKPTIAITNKFASVVSGVNKVSFEATRDIPEGYELLEHGILVTTNSLAATEDEMLLNKGITTKKAVVMDKKGTYTINIAVGDNVNTIIYARGYMSVKDINTGEIKVIYSQIKEGSFSSLSN